MQTALPSQTLSNCPNAEMGLVLESPSTVKVKAAPRGLPEQPWVPGTSWQGALLGGPGTRQGVEGSIEQTRIPLQPMLTS